MQTNPLRTSLTQPRNGERGQALITVIAAFSLVLLLLTAALTMTQYQGRVASRQLAYQGQALNAAQAGLTDTLSWFRRQKTIVTNFDPKLNLAATPPVNDSEEPTKGIQRSFEMSDTFSMTGRYLAMKAYTDPVTNELRGVRDISALKGKSGTGTVWQIESRGCVIFGTYATTNDCTAAASSTGRIMAREVVRAEIQRLNLILPAGGAAIYARRASGINISTGSRIQGGDGIGFAYPKDTGTYTNNGIVTGATPITVDNTTAPLIKIQDIFGVTAQEVLTMADINVASVAELPEEGMPQMNLVVIRGNATFDTKYPLSGSGILIVFGNLTIPANTNASFSGVIYVTGNFSIAQPALISGAVIAAGNADPTTAGTGGGVTVTSSGDIAEIDYDNAIIQQIQAQMGNYRFSRGMYLPDKKEN